MVTPTWGDTVRVKDEAPPVMRPGSLAAICGVRALETAAQAKQFACSVPTMVFLVEFSDGRSLEIPADLLEVVVDDTA